MVLHICGENRACSFLLCRRFTSCPAYQSRIMEWSFSRPVVSDPATPGTAALQVSLPLTISQSLPNFMSIASVMSSNHLIFCLPLLLLPSIFPSIRVLVLPLHIRWPKYWSFSFSISPSNECSGLISFSIDWFDFLVQWMFRIDFL